VRDLLVIVPSRGRPESIRRLWDAMQETCQGDTELLVSLDADDPAHAAYPPGPMYQTLFGTRGVVGHLNASADLVSGYRFAGTLGDDNVPRTGGWDVRVMEALGETPFAFANDLYPREPGSHPAHIFMRSEVVQALGYLGPPQFRHMFVDNAWKAWGEACGITYLHDVILEHLHFTQGKSAHDATYRGAENAWDGDKAAWEAYQADGLAEDIAKIKAAVSRRTGAANAHL